MQSPDDTLIRPISSTSPTVCSIFTLKNSNPIHPVWSINSFCHFKNSNVANFCEQVPFLKPTQYDHDKLHSYREIISRLLTTKDNSCAYYTPPSVKLVFQEVFMVKTTYFQSYPLHTHTAYSSCILHTTYYYKHFSRN